MSCQKGSINIILIVIIVALVGAGAYFVSTRQPPLSIPNPNAETAYDGSLDEGWDSYTDEEDGYSLRVPPNWIRKEFIEPHSDNYFKIAFGMPGGVLAYIDEEEAYKVYEFGCNVVTISEIPTEFSLGGTIYAVHNRAGLDDAQRTEILVGSREAVQFNESIFPFDSGARNTQFDGFTIFVKHPKNDVVLMFAGLSCETEKEQFKSMYEMILSSVKFSETIQQVAQQPFINTNSWPLYRSKDFGYSLRMSPEFRERWEGSAGMFEINNTQALSRPPHGRVVLDINIFKYGESGLRGTKEENQVLFEQLKNANVGEELFLEREVILKVSDINLDGHTASQLLVGGSNTYGTVYAGENYFLQFELEADRRADLEKYIPYVDAALTTFRFNNFNP